MLPILPLVLGVAAVAALAMGAKKDAAGPAGPGQPGGPAGPGGPAFNNPFDQGLSQAQVIAVQTALNTETNPDVLDSDVDHGFMAFSKSMLPEFPIAAAALKARAIQLRIARAAQQPPPAPSIPFQVPAVPGTILPSNVFQPPAPLPPPAPPFAVPAVFSATPQTGTVTTHDTGPSGALLVRAIPDANGPPIGSNAHGATVTVLGPAINGFYPLAPIGFSSAAFITLDGASASGPQPGAPGAPFIPILAPGGGLSFPSFPDIGSQALINTNDTGPSGNLNVRATPSAQGTVIGSNAHGSIVTIAGPLVNGFYPITGAGGAGFSSAQFLAPAPSAVSAGFAGSPVGGRVMVTANLLGLRGTPDARAPYVAQAAKGAVFTVAGPDRAGYLPVRDDAGNVAWASLVYLKGIGGVAAGNDVGAGPSTPFAELHMTALALKTALATHGCRSYNEPLVKDFQRVAKRAGIYQGDIDGWYGTVTQASLSKIVGKPAPACFAEAKGGPSNPNEYWSPMGV